MNPQVCLMDGESMVIAVNRIIVIGRIGRTIVTYWVYNGFTCFDDLAYPLVN